MPDNVALWIGGLLATIVLGLLGVVYTSLRSQDAKTIERLDKHADDDIRVHERVARLEEKVDRNAEKIDRHDDELKLHRERYHNFRDDLTRYIGTKLDEARALLRRDKDG